MVGWALSIVVYVWNVRNKPKIRQQTQNLKTKKGRVGVEHRGHVYESSYLFFI